MEKTPLQGIYSGVLRVLTRQNWTTLAQYVWEASHRHILPLTLAIRISHTGFSSKTL
jgi:hypothetical protein